MKSIKIYSSPNFDTYINVVVCNNRKQMFEELKKHKLNTSNEIFYDKNTAATFCPTVQIIRSDITGILSSNEWGTMFLNIEDINKMADDIIAHECAHASFAFQRNILRIKTDMTFLT